MEPLIESNGVEENRKEDKPEEGLKEEEEEEEEGSAFSSPRVSSLSEYLHRELNELSRNPSAIEKFKPHLSEIDAHVILTSTSTGQLPPLDWKQHFRKSYSIVFWIRPVVLQQQDELAEEPRGRRLFYRFSTSNEDHSGVGVCVQCSNWIYNPKMTTIEATLTCYTLPPKTQLLQVPLALKENQWSLVCISHSFPYLKRPEWILTVNGDIQGRGELNYPVLDHAHNRQQIMEHVTLFHNLAQGGVAVTNFQRTDDSKLTASQLVESQKTVWKRLEFHLASVAIHREAIPPELLSLIYLCGPALSLQHGGRIVAPLPPIENWTKGSSLDSSAQVGIPIATHYQYALHIQQLVPTAMAFFSTARAKFVTSQGQPRIVLSQPYLPGDFGNTPKVGLVQPEVAADGNHLLPEFHIFGSRTRLQHAMSDYLLLQSSDEQELDETQLLDMSKLWSVVLLEQGLLPALLMPFFLAQAPPTHKRELQVRLHAQSCEFLWKLYSSEGGWAAELIGLLVLVIANGGARAEEMVLQSGAIHILASTLCTTLKRAEVLELTKFQTMSEFVQHAMRVETSVSALLSKSSETSAFENKDVCPGIIPPRISKAVAALVATASGRLVESEYSPATRIVRQSDFALSAVFGLALNFDLWGAAYQSYIPVLQEVTIRYGNVQGGQILRRQIPIQTLLDMIRARFDTCSSKHLATRLTDILQHMLLASLSHRSNIAMAEQDVAACIGALSDSPLGSLLSHVVLSSLSNILEWCSIPTGAEDNDDQLLQIASRLGRNLIMSQYHDVLAPMLLSRTVFCGERSMTSSLDKKSATSSAKNKQQAQSSQEEEPTTTWDHHWRMALTLFAWQTSISGAEGAIAAQSTGSLLLASALAGSLQGSLMRAERDFMANLFLPPPTMALMIHSSTNSNSFNPASTWTYTDLLEDRLQVMMPLLPGLVVSLVSSPLESQMLSTLEEMVGAVCGSFHRVFSHWIQTHLQSTGNWTRKVGLTGKISPQDSNICKAAKDFVPHFVHVLSWLERHVRELEKTGESDAPIVVFKQRRTQSSDQGKSDGSTPDAWADVANMNHSANYDAILDVHFQLKYHEKQDNRLQVCLKSILSTTTDLVCYSCRIGGGVTADMIWRLVYTTLMEREGTGSTKKDKNPDETKKYQEIANDIFCRVAAVFLTKIQRSDRDWALWPRELCRATTRLVNLIEDKGLLKPYFSSLTTDQILLQSSLLDVMSYGRQMTGWCQVIPSAAYGGVLSVEESPIIEKPQEGAENDEEQKDTLAEEAKNADLDMPGSSSKLLLPMLQPCLRLTYSTLEHISSSLKIVSPGKTPVPFIDCMSVELRQTTIAAVVGLSFSKSRDTALHALAILRHTARTRAGKDGDEGIVDACNLLFCEVVEEIQVRYDGERRRREQALISAYNQDDPSAAQHETQSSKEVERMLIGGDLVPKPTIEEITFDTDINAVDDIAKEQDFVIFPEPKEPNSDDSGAEIGQMVTDEHKIGFDQYNGLGSTLDECSALIKSDDISSQPTKEQVKILLSFLDPFLDTWNDSPSEERTQLELAKRLEETTLSEPFGAKGINVERSETAADAMSTYIEMASVEKSRVSEYLVSFLPALRQSCQAYSARYCWAKYFEMVDNSGDLGMEALCERGIADGNRDIRSRLISMPCTPQFKRYIPAYLDHTDQVEPYIPPPPPVEPEIPADRSIQRVDTGESVKSGEHGMKRGSTIDADENLAFHKSFAEKGKLEIVDITKKEVVEDEHPELVQELEPRATMDEFDDDDFGDGSLGFPSRTDETNPDGSTAESTENSAPGDVSQSSRITERDHHGNLQHHISSSLYSHPPDNSSSIMSMLHSGASLLIEKHFDNCLHVKAEGSRKCTVLLTATHLLLEYDPDTQGMFEGEMMAVKEEAERQRLIQEGGGGSKNSDGEDADQIEKKLERRQKEKAAERSKSIRWNLSELSHVYLRRYRLRDSSLEMFFIPSGGTSYGGFGLFSPTTSLFLDFGSGHDCTLRRDEAAHAIMRRSPPQTIKQWPDKGGQFLHEQLSRLAMGWVEGRITNFDYLLHLNMLAGRSYNDLCQYPVMPWVLSNYSSEELPDLADRSNFRDLSKPMGALNPDRLEDFLERFETFADPTIPPFMYGSHYSTSGGVVLHFLVRMHPFAGLHRQLQGGHFDVADRLFSSVPRTWEMCTGYSAAEVKELTPEWYCNPTFLKNANSFKLGTSQDGELLGDVVLPPWAKGSPERFIEFMRNALESDICSDMLPDWIDLIFGRKQQGPEAIKAHNVFFYLTYYGSVDIASIEDESLRQATELQIAHFGQCPMQLFVRPHVRRVQNYINYRQLTFFQMLSAYSQGAKNTEPTLVKEPGRQFERNRDGSQRVFGQPLFLPFSQAPNSHRIRLEPPPPGPHADLIAVRLAGVDRCLGIDANGVFHSFRWAWKADNETEQQTKGVNENVIDMGNFIAQRELHRFKSLPRLIHTPPSKHASVLPAVAISKTLFASRSVLLVLSDGDGKGALSMQLVDPAKGLVKGEAIVPSVHASRITCIAMDPIGTAAGHGGVGGELAMIGSADGCASLWRFMSSHFLPLRPRIRMRGHGGSRVYAVALSSSIHVCASVSAHRCCIFSVGNGAMIRSFPPPQDTLKLPNSVKTKTVFCDTPALCLSVQGFLVAVCKTTIVGRDDRPSRDVITLHLFSLEGISLGSKALESWRGIPHKITCTPDGTAVTVCSGRGLTVHRLSAVTPLEFIDEWYITDTDDLTEKMPAAFDIDYGPSLMRPIVAAAACSDGVMQLHALPGISPWSERHKKPTVSIGEAFSKTGGRIKNAVGRGLGFGKNVVGVGKDISNEVASGVKERGVGGFLAGTLFRANKK